MKSFLRRVSLPIAIFAWVMLIAAPTVFAHHPDLSNSFTVDQRTQVPGAMLEPNTNYVLKVLKSDTDRHILQIYNEDQSRMLTTFLGESDPTTGQSGFTFIEMQGNQPKVVREWSDPKWGGLKFVYSAEEARNISQHSSEGVLWTRKKVNANMKDLKTVQVATMQSGASRPEQAGRGESARNAPEQTARNERNNQLPRTAGELPLVALVGFAFLSLGLGIQAVKFIKY